MEKITSFMINVPYGTIDQIMLTISSQDSFILIQDTTVVLRYGTVLYNLFCLSSRFF